MPTEFDVRRGGTDDFLAMVRLFDGALLDTDEEQLRAFLSERSPDGFVLIATISDRTVGAIAVREAVAGDHDGASAEASGGVDVDADAAPAAHIVALAVRPARRGRGIGHTLVSAGADRVAPRPLSAAFDERVRPFYSACGFDIEPRDGRLWGIRRVDTDPTDQ